MTPWFVRPCLAALAMVVIAAGCGGDDDSAATAADEISSSVEDDTSTTDATTTSIVASTVSSSATSEPTTSTTAAVNTTEPSTSTSASTTPTTDSSTTTSPPGTVIDGGSFYEFSSPTGNIACNMTPDLASCWIGEKAWTIEQPSGPDCEISDWGNVVDLTADGPLFPCYTDMAWNIFAPALAYGDAVEVGSLRCESAQTGVTCRNAAGNGFTAARAAVRLF